MPERPDREQPTGNDSPQRILLEARWIVGVSGEPENELLVRLEPLHDGTGHRQDELELLVCHDDTTEPAVAPAFNPSFEYTDQSLIQVSVSDAGCALDGGAMVPRPAVRVRGHRAVAR
ncbi:MAG: hypothetical protein N2Z82_05990 [Thermomicrobium sp.]|nr:hypothetical protein [Thermomicrobium sp.]